jgi:hypothetical protein
MGQAEPPLSLRSTNELFYLGKDSQGHWVVKDRSGLRGGIFIGQAEALRFALFENGHDQNAIIMVPGVLELDMTPKASLSTASRQTASYSLLI